MNKTKYTMQDLEDAYRVWVNAPRNNRDVEWQTYVAIRDVFVFGIKSVFLIELSTGRKYKTNKLDALTFG